MVDSIVIPQDLAKPIKIEVKDNSAQLQRFLTDLLIRVQNLEKQNIDLTKRVTALENP